MAAASGPASRAALRHTRQEATGLVAAPNATLWLTPFVHSRPQRTALPASMRARSLIEGTVAWGERRATPTIERRMQETRRALHSYTGICRAIRFRAATDDASRSSHACRVDAPFDLNMKNRRGCSGSSGSRHHNNRNGAGTESIAIHKDVCRGCSGSNCQICASSLHRLPIDPSSHDCNSVTSDSPAAVPAPSRTSTYAKCTNRNNICGSSCRNIGCTLNCGISYDNSFLSNNACSSCTCCWVFGSGSSNTFRHVVRSNRSAISCSVHRCQVNCSCGAAWGASRPRFFSNNSSKSVKLELLRQQWPLIRQEMVNFFRSQMHVRSDSRNGVEATGVADAALGGAAGDRGSKQWENNQTASSSRTASTPSLNSRSSYGGQSTSSNVPATEDYSRGIYSVRARSGKVNILCRPWERFVRKEELQRANYVPCIVEKYGVERRLAIHRETLEALAFEEEHGHLSYFVPALATEPLGVASGHEKARLFRLHIGSWIEECIPTYVQADPVARRLYFVKFDRHVPGTISEVDVPTALVGLLACPAYQKGCHVDLVMPTIRCQCVGADLPPPIFVDISRLHFRPPYSAVTVADLQGVLPRDGTVRFHPAYGDLQRQEVVWAYEVGTLPEAPLPDEFVDPNFINRKGQKMDVMFHRQFPN